MLYGLHTSSHNVAVLSADRPCTISRCVVNDPARVQRVLIGLLSGDVGCGGRKNAIAFSSAVGPISSRRTIFYFDISSANVNVAPRFLARVCRPFTRRNSSTHDGFRKANVNVSVIGSLVSVVNNAVRVSDRINTKDAFGIRVPLSVSGGPRTGRHTSGRACDYSLTNVGILLTRSGRLGTRVTRTLLRDRNVIMAHTTSNGGTISLCIDHPTNDFSTVLVSVVVPNVSNCRTAHTVHLDRGTSTTSVPVVTLATGTFGRSTGTTRSTNVGTRLPGPLSFGGLGGVLTHVGGCKSISL